MTEVRTCDKALALAKIIGASLFIFVVVVSAVFVVATMVDVAISGGKGLVPLVIVLLVAAAITVAAKVVWKILTRL